MKLNITPTNLSLHQKKGVLIRGSSPKEWMQALQVLNIDLMHTPIFPIPSKTANKLYGCFIILNAFNDKTRQLNTALFQSINDYIYIPEFSKLSPILSKEESQTLFKQPHIFHPDFGWVALNESINWKTVFSLSAPKALSITQPAKTIYSPQAIKSFQLIADEEIDIIKALDLKIKPPIKDTLNNFDKVKLKLFKTLFATNKKENGEFNIKRKGFLKWLDNMSPKKNDSSKSKWEKNLENLLFRNQKETDKLLMLFKNNPDLALKNALPLDMLGTSRDSNQGLFKLFQTDSATKNSPFSKFITNALAVFMMFAVVYLIFILFKGLINGSLTTFFYLLLKIIGIILGVCILLVILENMADNKRDSEGSVNLDSERMNALRIEYEKLVEEAIKQNDYKKAASIYIKLLKDHHKAASILEDGAFYQEAAVIHLKYNKDKRLAAEAYEKGKFYNKAITLQKELENNEKIGDLYKLIHNKPEADNYYQIVIDDYLKQSQHVKASLIYKYKIEDSIKAQTPLLEGWKTNNDAFNCLNNYFSNFPNTKLLKQGIHFILTKETNKDNINVFLKALKKEHTKHEDIQEFTQNIAYEIVANHIKNNPSIAFELSTFNTDNNLLNSDTSKYVKQEKKKKRT